MRLPVLFYLAVLDPLCMQKDITIARVDGLDKDREGVIEP
jgi:hypothetical protein